MTAKAKTNTYDKDGDNEHRRRRLIVIARFDRKLRRWISALIFIVIIFFTVKCQIKDVQLNVEGDKTVSLSTPPEQTQDCKSLAPGCLIFSREVTDERVVTLMSLMEANPNFYDVNVADTRGLQHSTEKKTGDNPPIYFTSEDYATLTQASTNRKLKMNQDRGLIVYPFHVTDRNHPAPQHQHDFIIGTFDGHGDMGHAVSEYAVQRFAMLLAAALDSVGVIEEEAYDDDDEENSIIETLRNVFLEIDAELSPQNALEGGCTGSVVVRWGLHLYFANAGDSRSFVATYDNQTKSIEIPYITRQDKPNLPDEKSRIEQAGGHVFVPLPPKDPIKASRVIVTSKTKKENVGLAMSRSIGDSEWSPLGVTAEPIVSKINIADIANKPNVHIFVVSASDGLFDATSPEIIAKHLASSLYEPTINGHPVYPLVACKNIIQLATPTDPLQFRDDITVTLMKVSV